MFKFWDIRVYEKKCPQEMWFNSECNVKCMYSNLNQVPNCNNERCWIKLQDDWNRRGWRSSKVDYSYRVNKSYKWNFVLFQISFNSVTASYQSKAPPATEQSGVLLLINAECHECSTLLFLTFKIRLCLTFLLMENYPVHNSN